MRKLHLASGQMLQAGSLCSPEITARVATFSDWAGLTLGENRGVAANFYLRSRVTPGGNLSRNRFAGTDRLSSQKRAAGVSIADFERTLRASHQNGGLRDSREGTNSLLQHVWQNCRCARKHNRGRRGCRHAGSSGRKICPGADALLHAVQRSGRNARWNPTGLPCLARLCSHAPGICNCVFQFRQCRNSSHCYWQNAHQPLLEPGGIQVSERPRSICRPASCATAAILGAMN